MEMPTNKELVKQRQDLVANARKLANDAEERGGMTAEDQAKFDQMIKDAQSIGDQINQRNQNQAALAGLDGIDDDSEGWATEAEQRERDAESKNGRKTSASDPEKRSHESRGNEPLMIDYRGMQICVEPGSEAYRRSAGESGERYRADVRSYLRGKIARHEIRGLQTDKDTKGGYLVAPMQMAAGILQAADNAVFVRRYATVTPLNTGDSLGIVSLDTDPSDATWTPEIPAIDLTEDDSLAFGTRELHPTLLTKLIKVSEKMLRNSATDVESIIRDRVAYKVGVTMEQAYLTGSGSNQPLGVFTASSNGINTDRDVATGNATTSIAFDGLQSAKYSLKQAYRNRCRWLFHRDAIAQIAKLKDGENRYLWQPAVTADTPDRILNIPVDESEYVPNTFTTGQYVGLLADWSYYQIADSLSMRIQVLDQLFSLRNQVGYKFQMDTDGMPTLSEAFVRVKLA